MARVVSSLENGTPARWRDVANALGCDVMQIRERFKRAVRADIVTHVGEGHYRLTPRAAKLLAGEVQDNPGFPRMLLAGVNHVATWNRDHVG